MAGASSSSRVQLLIDVVNIRARAAPTLEVAIAAAALAVGYVVWCLHNWWTSRINLPAVGVPPGPLGSWRAAFRYVTRAQFILREGAALYGPSGGAFKISTPARWLVVVTSPEAIRELSDASDDDLSFHDAGSDRISLPYTMDQSLMDSPVYHMKIISHNLTRRITNVLPEVIEELALSFEDNTDIGVEWTKVDNFTVLKRCIGRTTNRVFVGLPLCRNEEFLERMATYGTTVSKAALLIDWAPYILKRIVAKIVVSKKSSLNTISRFVGPIVEQRKRKAAGLGKAWERPNDAIQWLIDAAPNKPPFSVMIRILFLNLAAMHTTTLTMTHVLYDLAPRSELQAELRKEVVRALAEEGGITKQALTKMKKLDSVVRESLRYNGITMFSSMRKSRKRYTFSSIPNLTIPKGTTVIAPSIAIHLQQDDRYDPLRFARMREEEGNSAKYQAVSATGTDYLSFGHGRHACPGRFFAVNEIKIFLVYLLQRYEWRIPGGGERPANRYFAQTCVPPLELGLEYRRISSE